MGRISSGNKVALWEAIAKVKKTLTKVTVTTAMEVLYSPKIIHSMQHERAREEREKEYAMGANGKVWSKDKVQTGEVTQFCSREKKMRNKTNKSSI